MSALSLNEPGDPRSHRYYAPRQRRVVAREATLQPVLERLRGSTRAYSADERLSGDTDAAALPRTEFVVVPHRRFPLAILAAFAGGATAVAALALAYVAFDANGAALLAAARPSAPAAAAAQAPAMPAKIDARVAPNQPVARAAQPSQVATAGDGAALPIDTSKGDRLDAAASPRGAASYDPLRAPAGLWGQSPTQAAIEGTHPALAASGAPAAPEPAAAPPQQATPEHDAHEISPVRHHVRAHHHVRHVRHARHHTPATNGQAVAGAGQNAGAASTQPAAPKKFLGLFGG